MGQYTGVGVLPKGWTFCLFCVKFIESFYFYDMIYFMMKISVYQEFNVCMVMDQFHPLVINSLRLSDAYKQ